MKEEDDILLRVEIMTGKDINKLETENNEFYHYDLGEYKGINFEPHEIYKVWIKKQVFWWDTDITIKRVELFTDQDNELLARIDKLKEEKLRMEKEICELEKEYRTWK